MPQLPVDALRARLRQDMGAATASHPLVVFSCEHGAAVDGRQALDVQTYPLLCTGQLPPSFVEYALRDGAAGVVVATCREGGCEFRPGQRWTAERLASASRICASMCPPNAWNWWLPARDEPLLGAAIDRLRAPVRAFRSTESRTMTTPPDLICPAVHAPLVPRGRPGRSSGALWLVRAGDRRCSRNGPRTTRPDPQYQAVIKISVTRLGQPVVNAGD
jgi:hypothetical protein